MIQTLILLLAAGLTGLSYLVRQLSFQLPVRWKGLHILSSLKAVPYVMLSLLVLLLFSHTAQLVTYEPVWLAAGTFCVLLLILTRKLLLSYSLSITVIAAVYLQAFI